MKYFTRGFFCGWMSDKRRTAAIAGYAKHLAALKLSPDLDMLARLNMHDARVLAVAFDAPNQSLQLRLQRGDLQCGYVNVTLRFSHVTIGKKSLQELRDAVRPSNVEVLAEELDTDKGRFTYRLVLWPKGQVSLSFTQVKLKMHAVTGRRHT